MDFSGVGLKIERAQRHTADLNNAIDSTLNAERYVSAPSATLKLVGCQPTFAGSMAPEMRG
jgi:hypothetical protein